MRHQRMTEEKAKRLITLTQPLIGEYPLDDEATFKLFQNADTDGIFMMETDWDKYDLKQIKPANIDELTVTLALSHGPALNPYIYTYIKRNHIKPFTYPIMVEIPEIASILADTRGMLLWKEQKENILNYIDSLTEEQRNQYRMPIRVIVHKIEHREHGLSCRKFFKDRALLCYKSAYLKVHHRDYFDWFSHFQQDF